MTLPEYFDVYGTSAPAGIPIRFKEWTSSGAWGDPTEASKEAGEKMVNAMVEGLAIFLRKLKSTPMEELIPPIDGKKFTF